MPAEYYIRIRHRLKVTAISVPLVIWGLFFLQTANDRADVNSSSNGLIYIAIALFLTLLVLAIAWLFLRQLHSIEVANHRLCAQQEEMQLKLELLDTASDAVLLLDKEANFIYFNKALPQMTGYTPEELQQRGLHGIEPPEYVARIQANIQMLLQQGEAIFESAYLCRSGSIMPIEVHARQIEIAGRPLLMSVVRDISERKEMEDALHKVAAEWRSTFDAVEDAIWLLDMEHRIIRANKATETIFGMSPQEVIGKFCCEVAHGRLTQLDDCPSQEMLNTGKRGSIQLQVGTSWFDVSVDPIYSNEGEIVNIVHIVSNITLLKKAEQREHIRADILERIASGESLPNLLTFIALGVEKENPQMICSILLASDDGKRLLNGAAPSLPDFYNLATHRTKIGEGVGSCGTAAFRRERVVVEDIDSHPFWKSFTAVQEAGLRSCWSEPIISSTGTLLGTFAIYQRAPASPNEDEISLIQQASAFAGIAIERSKGDAERMELEHLLSQSQKMEAVGHLSGGIAHDFNNLLTPILIYADMLKRSLPDNEKAKLQLDGIIKASGKARDLTQQLLSFGRKQVMQMQVVDLNDVIMSFHPILRRTLR